MFWCYGDVLWNEMSVWMNMFVWFHTQSHSGFETTSNVCINQISQCGHIKEMLWAFSQHTQTIQFSNNNSCFITLFWFLKSSFLFQWLWCVSTLTQIHLCCCSCESTSSSIDVQTDCVVITVVHTNTHSTQSWIMTEW